MLLCVNSSVREEGSKSRELVNAFVKMWLDNNSNEEVIQRDVGINPPMHPSQKAIQANYVLPENRTREMLNLLAESDELIDELIKAEHLVFGVPLYNFSVPSTFKAYIDNIVRVNRTFRLTQDGGFEGLLQNKKMLVISTKGAIYSGTPMENYNLLDPYIRTVFGFMGVTDIKFVSAEGLDFADEDYQHKAMEKAKEELKEIAKTWGN